jgi:hypothetical protein
MSSGVDPEPIASPVHASSVTAPTHCLILKTERPHTVLSGDWMSVKGCDGVMGVYSAPFDCVLRPSTLLSRIAMVPN